MGDRAVRACVLGLLGFFGIVIAFALILMADATLTWMGAHVLVARYLSPAIVLGLALFIYGYMSCAE